MTTKPISAVLEFVQNRSSSQQLSHTVAETISSITGEDIDEDLVHSLEDGTVRVIHWLSVVAPVQDDKEAISRPVLGEMA